MKTKRWMWGLVLLTCMLLIAGPAMAVDSLKGKGSVGGNLALSNMTTEQDPCGYGDCEDDSQQLTIDFNLNYFLTDSFEIGVRDILSQSMRDDQDYGSNYLLIRLAFNLYSPGSTFVPYLGGQLGYYRDLSDYEGNSDRDDSATAYGGFVGFKNFISEDLSANAELNYLTSDIDVGTSTLTITDMKILIGLSYYFGG